MSADRTPSVAGINKERRHQPAVDAGIYTKAGRILPADGSKSGGHGEGDRTMVLLGRCEGVRFVDGVLMQAVSG